MSFEWIFEASFETPEFTQWRNCPFWGGPFGMMSPGPLEVLASGTKTTFSSVNVTRPVLHDRLGLLSQFSKVKSGYS
jgi:hypothetical protein